MDILLIFRNLAVVLVHNLQKVCIFARLIMDLIWNNLL